MFRKSDIWSLYTGGTYAPHFMVVVSGGDYELLVIVRDILIPISFSTTDEDTYESFVRHHLG